MKKNFILGYFFGCFLFFLTSEQNLNLAKMEKFDLKLLKNEIVVLNLSANNNIFANTYQSSIYDVAEVAVKKENSISIPIDIKTKKAVDYNHGDRRRVLFLSVSILLSEFFS